LHTTILTAALLGDLDLIANQLNVTANWWKTIPDLCKQVSELDNLLARQPLPELGLLNAASEAALGQKIPSAPKKRLARNTIGYALEMSSSASLERFAAAIPRQVGAFLPVIKPNQAEFKAQWDNFLLALRDALAHGSADIDVWLSNLLGAIDQHLGCFIDPWGIGLPLPEFLHTRTALLYALCKEEAQAEVLKERTVLLVSSGFYDISEHLQMVINPDADASGIAKRLRARSLEVAMQNEGLAQAILSRTKSPVCQRLMAAGARSLFVLPDNPEVIRALEGLRLEIEQQGLGEGWLIKPLLVWTQGTLNEVGAYKELYRRHKIQETIAKQQPYLYALQDPSFTPVRSVTGRPCRAYPNQAASGEDGLSAAAHRDRMVGEALVNPNLIGVLIETQSQSLNAINTSGGSLRLLMRQPTTCFWLRSKVDFSPANCPWMLRPLLGQVPADAGKVLDFHQLAKRATPKGLEALAALKIDVDHLGKTLGMIAADKPLSFSLAVARWMDWFFTVELGKLIENKPIYSVYSGGDDLYLIGAWDLMLETALEIDQLWQRYRQGSELTLSAGVCLFKPSLPVPIFTQQVSAAIDHAKFAGRNKIHVLGRTLSWQDFGFARDQAKSLAERIARGKITTGLINRLLELERIWQQSQTSRQDQVVVAMRYKALMAHALRDYPKLRQEWKDLFVHQSQLMQTARVWMQWALYLVRA
jgi:CRISPR-associated protein Csm1